MRISSGRAILDWILVLVFCTFLFLSFDLMPRIWSLMWFFMGSDVKNLPAFLIIAIFCFLLLYTIFIKRQRYFLSYIWFVILIVYAYIAYNSIGNPYDRMHLIEYYMLGLFLYRLLTNYMYNRNIYILGLLFTIVIGIVDECAQFFTIYRSFSIADIAADFTAALLAQLSIALVIRPAFDISIPKLRRKIKGLRAQDEWVKEHKVKNID